MKTCLFIQNKWCHRNENKIKQVKVLWDLLMANDKILSSLWIERVNMNYEILIPISNWTLTQFSLNSPVIWFSLYDCYYDSPCLIWTGLNCSVWIQCTVHHTKTQIEVLFSSTQSVTVKCHHSRSSIQQINLNTFWNLLFQHISKHDIPLIFKTHLVKALNQSQSTILRQIKNDNETYLGECFVPIMSKFSCDLDNSSNIALAFDTFITGDSFPDSGLCDNGLKDLLATGGALLFFLRPITVLLDWYAAGSSSSVLLVCLKIKETFSNCGLIHIY